MNNFQRKTVDRVSAQPRDLTEWEQEFIESLSSKPDCFELTKKQNHILNDLGSKVQRFG